MGKTYTKRKDEYSGKKNAGKHRREGPNKRDPFDDMALGIQDRKVMFKRRDFTESF